MIQVDYERCTGCGACMQKCPRQCISWKQGELGFYYPSVDKEKCINCGMCEKVCPIHKEIKQPESQTTYAVTHKDTSVLSESTSGGAFSAIANMILAHGGIVYGAIMTANMQVKHARIEKEEELACLRGSKYVQSNIEETYKQAERDLKKRKLVLYSGTPCQIAGLQSFLGKKYDNLYTIDIVCHGVGSQLYFNKYMDFARKRYGDIQTLKFRSKEFVGWSCGGVVVVVNKKSGEIIHIPYRDYDNYYYSYFLSGDIYRRSCYSCKYANTKRTGDFTLGDYWGVEALQLPLKTENGCSLVLVNNERAMRLFQKLDLLETVQTTIEEATHCNKQLKQPSKLTNCRDVRISEYETMDGQQIQKAYLKSHRKTVLKGQLKAILPYRVKLFIRKHRK